VFGGHHRIIFRFRHVRKAGGHPGDDVSAAGRGVEAVLIGDEGRQPFAGDPLIWVIARCIQFVVLLAGDPERFAGKGRALERGI
jgi:hypothetical protein